MGDIPGIECVLRTPGQADSLGAIHTLVLQRRSSEFVWTCYDRCSALWRTTVRHAVFKQWNVQAGVGDAHLRRMHDTNLFIERTDPWQTGWY